MLLHVALFVLVGSLITLTALERALSRALGALQTPPEVAGELPALIVVRPVRGLDPGLHANVRAALRQVYPGPLETLFVVDDESEPALPVIARAIDEARQEDGVGARIVLSGTPPPSRTGKLHAMIRGLAEARVEAPFVCFADSDTRPGPTMIRDLAASLAACPDAGAVFARTIGTQTPRTLGDVVYALLLDGLYGPQAALTMQRCGSLPFIMGQTMVLRRSALDACGGLEASEGELVDDMHIGARLAAEGHRNLLVDAPLPIVQRGLSWSELRAIALRWIVYARTGIPFWPFNVPSVVWTLIGVSGLVGAGIAITLRQPAALACFVTTSGSVVVALESLRRRQGGPPLPMRLWWAPAVCLALLPWWYAQARFAKAIVWRGRTYSLDGAGRLGADRRPPARPPLLLPPAGELGSSRSVRSRSGC